MRCTSLTAVLAPQILVGQIVGFFLQIGRF
jgi:hypothetical protein